MTGKVKYVKSIVGCILHIQKKQALFSQKMFILPCFVLYDYGILQSIYI